MIKLTKDMKLIVGIHYRAQLDQLIEYLFKNEFTSQDTYTYNKTMPFSSGMGARLILCEEPRKSKIRYSTLQAYKHDQLTDYVDYTFIDFDEIDFDEKPKEIFIPKVKLSDLYENL